MVGNALALLGLTVGYALVCWLLALLLRRMGAGKPRAIVLGCLLFGLLGGLLVAWAWPAESSIYGNVYAVLIGDRLYAAAIEYLGDSHSPNAHETIPWILRIPQIYPLVSVVLSGIGGWCLQWLYGQRSSDRAEQ